MSHFTSTLFFAVVNSTRDHSIIDAIANGSIYQQAAALDFLIKSAETPHYLVDTLQIGYNTIMRDLHAGIKTTFVDDDMFDIAHSLDDITACDFYLDEVDDAPTQKPYIACQAHGNLLVSSSEIYVGD
ncbi:hypothetical protein F-VV10_0097 [Faustovirus]|nr:hypothetical protein F-VV10_0097 [Faustovirus]